MDALTDTTKLSWSRVSTWAKCPRRFELRYLEGIPTQPSGPLLAGRAAHEAAAFAEDEGVPDAYAQADDATKKEITAQLGALFVGLLRDAVAEFDDLRWGGRSSGKWPNGEKLDWWNREGPMMMRRWLVARQRDLENGSSLWKPGAERRIAFDSEVGRVDAVVDAALFVAPTGELVIRDLKSGRPGWDSAVQLAVYALAVEAVDGIKPERGEFFYLRTGRVDPHDLRAFLPLVPELLKQHSQAVSSGVFPMSPGPLCRSCEVREACEYGKTLA